MPPPKGRLCCVLGAAGPRDQERSQAQVISSDTVVRPSQAGPLDRDSSLSVAVPEGQSLIKGSQGMAT